MYLNGNEVSGMEQDKLNHSKNYDSPIGNNVSHVHSNTDKKIRDTHETQHSIITH